MTKAIANKFADIIDLHLKIGSRLNVVSNKIMYIGTLPYLSRTKFFIWTEWRMDGFGKIPSSSRLFQRLEEEWFRLMTLQENHVK